MLPPIVNYAIHLIASGILLGVFFFVYTKVTPFDELAMIHLGNGAASLSLGGALIGFSLTLGSAIVHNQTLFEVIFWAIGAMLVQILVYAVASRLMHTVRAELETGNVAMGGFMGSVSLVAGIVNAACLS
ncbi:MAG: DUF350 domain-containing protein [Burkholderiaceae bacterium]